MHVAVVPLKDNVTLTHILTHIKLSLESVKQLVVACAKLSVSVLYV